VTANPASRTYPGTHHHEASPHLRCDDLALGVVEFPSLPHLDQPDLPENTMAAAERWAAGLGGPAYAIDGETAIKVVDGTVEVVSEGNWKPFSPRRSVERIRSQGAD
jgi:dipeptidase E